MDEGRKKKKRKKKKHRRSKENREPGAQSNHPGEESDTPVWTHAGSTKDSSSSSDSQSDSGVGSNPSFQSHQHTDTKPRWGTVVTPWPSPDPTREPLDDDPLSDRGEGDGDQEMPEAHKPQDIQGPQVLDPRPVRYQRGCSRLMTRRRPATVKSLRSLKSPRNPTRLSCKAFRPYPRPCQRLMGLLVTRYRLSSRKAWQKPPLKTGPSYGEPQGPYVTG